MLTFNIPSDRAISAFSHTSRQWPDVNMQQIVIEQESKSEDMMRRLLRLGIAMVLSMHVSIAYATMVLMPHRGGHLKIP